VEISSKDLYCPSQIMSPLRITTASEQCSKVSTVPQISQPARATIQPNLKYFVRPSVRLPFSKPGLGLGSAMVRPSYIPSYPPAARRFCETQCCRSSRGVTYRAQKYASRIPIPSTIHPGHPLTLAVNRLPIKHTREIEPKAKDQSPMPSSRSVLTHPPEETSQKTHQ
jgi:hypothetical protein